MARRQGRNPDLTAVELEVLDTFGNKADFCPHLTSEILNKAAGTIKAHRLNICSKLHCKNTYEAFFYAAHKGLLVNSRWEGR